MGASSNQHESKKQAQNFDAKNTIFSRRRFDVVFVLFFWFICLCSVLYGVFHLLSSNDTDNVVELYGVSNVAALIAYSSTGTLVGIAQPLFKQDSK